MKPAAPVTSIFIHSTCPLAGLRGEPSHLRHTRLCGTPEVPDVDDHLSLWNENVPVNGMGCAKDDQVCSLDCRFQRHETGIGNIWIGAQDFLGADSQQIAELIGEALSLVIGISLESHPKDGHT